MTQSISLCLSFGPALDSSIEAKGTFHGYGKDSDEHTPAFGRAFFDFVKNIPDKTFPRKSLMMHSMGNHVVFDGACYQDAPQVQFENIFMVAAVRMKTKLFCIYFSLSLNVLSSFCHTL